MVVVGGGGEWCCCCGVAWERRGALRALLSYTSVVVVEERRREGEVVVSLVLAASRRGLGGWRGLGSRDDAVSLVGCGVSWCVSFQSGSLHVIPVYRIIRFRVGDAGKREPRRRS